MGNVSELTEQAARSIAAEILAPINSMSDKPTPAWSFGRFVEHIFFPWFREKWKSSTRSTTVDRINRYLVLSLKDKTLEQIEPGELQALMAEKAGDGFSRNTVNHLRWDLKHILQFAVSRAGLGSNPADDLYTPRDCEAQEARSMTFDEVNLALGVLPLRERLVFEFAVIGGMRPGEILALKRGSVEGVAAKVRQRIYRGEIDSPKSKKSRRDVALADTVMADVRQ